MLYVILAVASISVMYLVVHAAVVNGVVDAWHKIEDEKKNQTRRLYDEK